jgi:hypothetical protein
VAAALEPGLELESTEEKGLESEAGLSSKDEGEETSGTYCIARD